MSYLTYNPATNRYPVRGFSNPNSVVSPEITDPYAANVILWLKGDGANNSTSIIDSSPIPKAITVNGNTKISTTQSKHGGSSIYFNGGSDSLSLDFDAPLGTGDFTIESWIYTDAITGDPGLVSTPNVNSGSFVFGLFSNGDIRWFANSGTTGITLSSWNHVAVTRALGGIALFVNGVLGATLTDSTNYSELPLVVGTDRSLTLPFRGYMDLVRITKGVARYTANFNPETDTFLDLQ